VQQQRDIHYWIFLKRVYQILDYFLTRYEPISGHSKEYSFDHKARPANSNSAVPVYLKVFRVGFQGNSTRARVRLRNNRQLLLDVPKRLSTHIDTAAYQSISTIYIIECNWNHNTHHYCVKVFRRNRLTDAIALRQRAIWSNGGTFFYSTRLIDSFASEDIKVGPNDDRSWNYLSPSVTHTTATQTSRQTLDIDRS
jgi:hypothetical protein